MIKFCVRILFFAGLFLLPQISFAQTNDFYLYRPDLVHQDSRSVRSTIVHTDKFIENQEEPNQKLFAGLARRDRNLQVDQVRTAVLSREVAPGKLIAASMERTYRYQPGETIVERPGIRGKNISIVQMRVANQTLSMDDYIQGTRIDFDVYLVEHPVIEKIASKGVGMSG
ncbi:hypothetical protein K9L27_01750 [Candidatus Gracilibacteria bacterium]|nr:hypothetical protein [Candidatus Gracilibacteria bacterium]